MVDRSTAGFTKPRFSACIDMGQVQKAVERPYWALTACFILWKLCLLTVVFASPGQGYDTSTTLVYPSSSDDGAKTTAIRLWIDQLTLKLTRWDAIYFTHIAKYGHVFEQEWAFGWGFTSILRLLCRGISHALPRLDVASNSCPSPKKAHCKAQRNGGSC